MTWMRPRRRNGTRYLGMSPHGGIAEPPWAYYSETGAGCQCASAASASQPRNATVSWKQDSKGSCRSCARFHLEHLRPEIKQYSIDFPIHPSPVSKQEEKAMGAFMKEDDIYIGTFLDLFNVRFAPTPFAINPETVYCRIVEMATLQAAFYILTSR